jgi:hypothetical protein
VYPDQSKPFPYRSGESKISWRSLIRLADPLSRKIPSTSVAIQQVSDGRSSGGQWDLRTFLLQEHATLGDDDGNIAVDEALSVLVGEGDRYVRIFDADVQRDAENTSRGFCYEGSSAHCFHTGL